MIHDDSFTFTLVEPTRYLYVFVQFCTCRGNLCRARHWVACIRLIALLHVWSYRYLLKASQSTVARNELLWHSMIILIIYIYIIIDIVYLFTLFQSKILKCRWHMSVCKETTSWNGPCDPKAVPSTLWHQHFGEASSEVFVTSCQPKILVTSVQWQVATSG